MNEESQEPTEPKSSKPEWNQWADLISDAFKEGGEAGTNDAGGSANKFREVIEKGIYDATYGLAYSLAYGTTVAKESIFKQAEEGVRDGTAAGREAAREAQKDTDEGPAPSPA